MSVNKGVNVVKILGKNHLRCMTQHVRECWENESYSNVTFVCKSDSRSTHKRLSANKAVLATSSRKLQSMLADTGDEHVYIIIPDESDFDSIKLLLQYIYTGEVHTIGLLKEQLESLITDWEIGYPEITSVPTSSPDCSAEFDATSVLSSPAIIAKNKASNNKNGRKTQKKNVENESLLPSEYDATTQNDLPESRDSEEDKADLLLSDAFYKEERSRNQQLTKTVEELMNTIKRHQLYVNYFIGPQEFTAPKITETKKQLSRDVRISCTTCGKQVCRRYMEYHMLTTHGNERPFLCEQCGAGFAMLIGLNHHLKLSHPNESQMQKFTCTLCDRVCRSNEGLKCHMMTHSDVKRFSCSICDKRFRFQTSLSNHKKLIHATDKPFACNNCDRRFLKESTYNRHLKTHDEGRLKRRLKKPSGPFICGTCGISFRREYGILVHEAQHKNEEPKLPCRRCPEIFPSIKLLRDHVRNQHQDSIFKCQYCPYYYNTKNRLEEHMLVHTESYEEPAATFPCNQCGKSFQTQMKVDSHIKLIHATERPFKCRFCSKDFRHKNSFLEHQRGHTGEKPYCCPHCPNTYRTNRQAKIHIRSHTGEKPYVCSQCGNSFTSSEGLRMHNKIHTGDKIQCATCGKVFRSKVKLKDHERTHNAGEDLGGDVDNEEESD